MPMPTPAGRYTLRVQHLPRVLGTKQDNAEVPESWPDPPARTARRYSAARESLSGGEQVVQGIRQSTGSMRLRIRGRAVPVAATDRVKVVATGEMWNVTGVYRDAAETVLTVERAAQQTTGQ